MLFDVEKVKEFLPHRYPFLFVDGVFSCEPLESIKAFKNISISDPVFQGHFPDKPIYPGVLTIEGMAQSAGILIKMSATDEEKENAKNRYFYFTSVDKAKFRSPVFPGHQLIYEVNFIKAKRNLWCFEGRAFADDKLAASALISVMLESR